MKFLINWEEKGGDKNYEIECYFEFFEIFYII